MKKILRLIGMLALNTCAISNVIACSNGVLDGTLKIINSGETNYEAWNLNGVGVNKPTALPNKDTVPKATQEISKDKLPVLAKILVQTIMTKAGMSEPILWFDTSLKEGEKCYNFTITNGTFDKTNTNKIWDVNGTTGRITVAITYQMGTVSKDKTFQSQEQVNVTFNLKCDYTQSDYMVYTTVESIKDIVNNSLEVTIVDKDKPKVGANFSDLSTNLQVLIQTKLVEQTKANNLFVDSVAIIQKGITGEVVSSQFTIEITFIVQFQDSVIDMAKISPYSSLSYPPTTIKFINS